MRGCTPIGNYTLKYHPDQIFYLLYAGVHPIRDYGHHGNLIPQRQYSELGRGSDKGCFWVTLWAPGDLGGQKGVDFSLTF